MPTSSWPPTRTPPDHPHSPLPQELHRDLTSCPKPAPNSWGARGAQGRPHLASFFLFLFPPSPTLSPWCCVRPWLWCCCIFPLRTPSTALCVGSPVLVLCAWASLQGLGSQSSPTPQHWNLFVFSSLGMEGKGSFKMKCTLTPPPHMLLLFPERSNPMSPTKLMQPVHLRGFRVLGGTQGSLVCEIMEPREDPGQCVFLVRVVLCFLFFFLLAPKMELA